MTPSAEERPAAYHVVMTSFPGITTAGQVLRKLREEGMLDGCEIEADAMVWRDEAGQIHVYERGSAGLGATFGAVTAGVVGLVGGPIVLPLMLAAGGVVGGVLGHYAGQSLPVEDLRKAGEALPPASSAYVAVVDAAHAAGVASAFAGEGAEVVDVAVHTELSSMIREAITHSVRRP